MRLRMVRDLSTRVVTQFDVINQILFGGKPPLAFDPAKYYTTGDIVYVINEDGTMSILQANTSGTFPTAHEPNFSEYNLSDVLEKQKQTIEELTGIRSKISDVVYKPHVYIYNISGTQTEIDVLDIFNHTNDYHYLEVYVDGLYLPTTEYEVEYNVDTSRHHMVFKTPRHDGEEILIRVNEANSILTRMVNRVNVTKRVEKEMTTIVDSRNHIDYSWVNANIPVATTFGAFGRSTTQRYNQTDYTMGLTLSRDTNNFLVNGTTTITPKGSATVATESHYGYIVYGDPTKPLPDGKEILNLMERGQFVTAGTDLPNAIPFFVYYPIGSTPNENLADAHLSYRSSLLYSEGVTLAAIGIWIPPNTTYVNQPFKVWVEPGQDNNGYDEYATHEEYAYGKMKIPYPADSNQIPMQFDLYVNHQFVPMDQVTIEMDDKNGFWVTDWPGKQGASTDFDLTFAFCYSVSNEIVLLKQDLTTTVQYKNDKFIVDMTPVDFVNSFQEVHAYVNDRVFDPTQYVLNSGRMNIPSTDEYLSEGDEVKFSVWTYILADYASNTTRHNSQSVPVLVDDTVNCVIPFLGYDENLYDILVFNDAGVYLSYVKWYVKGYDLQYFEHDDGISWGNILDFRLIDKDSSVLMQNQYIRVEEDGQEVFNLEFDPGVFAFYLMFNTNGEYIPLRKYSIEDGIMKLRSDEAIVHGGDILEFIGFRYVEDMTSTAFSYQVITPGTDKQSIFNNPYSDYDPNTDSLLIFNHEGMYIGERFYSIVNDTISLLGSSIPLNGYLEVIRIRNSSIFNKVLVPEDYLKRGILNLDDVYGDQVAERLMSLDLLSYKILSDNDNNYLRTKTNKIEVTATCRGNSYDATLLFSGTRCMLQIATYDVDGKIEGVVPGDIINVNIRAITKTAIRNYVFDVFINPKDLTKIILQPPTSTGEALIQPALQKLLNAFPLKDIDGMTEDYITQIKEGKDVRLAFTFNDEPLEAKFTETHDGDFSLDFGNITEGGVIHGTILINNVGNDFLFDITIDVTNPWYLVTTMIRDTFKKLVDLESPALKFKGLYGHTYQYTAKGNNYVDIRRFDPAYTASKGVSDEYADEEIAEGDIDMSSDVGVRPMSDVTVAAALGNVVLSPGVTVNSIDYLTGSIEVTGDGSVADQGIYIPILGLMDRTKCYAVGVDSMINTNSNAGHYIVELVITYGEASNPGVTYVGLTGSTLSAGVDLNNFNNLISVNLKICTNDTPNFPNGSNTVTITGLRMNQVATALSRVEDFEPYTGMAPAPNVEYPQAITGVGQPTYNLLNDKEFAKLSVSKSGFTCQLTWDSDEYMIKFAQYTNTVATGTETNLDLALDTSKLVENHSYKLFYDSNITSNVTYNLVADAGGNEVVARTLIWNTMSMASLNVRVAIDGGAAIDINTAKFRLWVVDVTDDPDYEWGYEPYGLKSEIYVKSGNLLDFTRIGSVKHNEDDDIVFKVGLEGRYDIYIELESVVGGGDHFIDDYHVEVGPITQNLSHEESLEVFEAGVYTIFSNDTAAQVNPYIFLAAHYDGEEHELGNSGMFRKITITEEMRAFEDFYITFGFKIEPTLPITERAIYPMVIRSSGDGSEWEKDVNENNVLTMDFCMFAENRMKFFHDDYIYSRDTELVNHFDPSWIQNRTVNGVTITNLGWGGFKITGSRLDLANTIQSQKTFSHKESINMFKPGYYMIASADTIPSLAPYVYMKVRTGVDGNLVSSTSSQIFSVCHITEKMYMDRNFCIEIGIIAEGSDPTLTMRTIMPMLLYSETSDHGWKASNGVFRSNFVPYFPSREGLPIDVDPSRYGYSGNGFFYEGDGKIHEYLRVLPFYTSILTGTWSASDPLDTGGTKHAFIYSGFANHIILPGYGGPDGTDLMPDIRSDMYITLPPRQRKDMVNHISIDDDGNLWLYDEDMATKTAAEFTNYIKSLNVKILLPLHSDTYVKREPAKQLNQEGLSTLVGYAPIMYIGTTFEPPYYSTVYPTFELTYERRQDT